MIRQLASQAIYVSDQEAAEDFWVRKMHFRVQTKVPMGNGFFWLEVGPAANQARLLLYPKALKHDWQTRQPSLVFECEDVRKTYNELKSAGVAVGPPPQTLDWGTFTSFQDPDGNEFLLKS